MSNAPLYVKRGPMLAPVNREGREFVGSLEEGERVVMERKKPRSMPMHRAYFAMLRNVYEATGRWPSMRAMEYEIALELKAGESFIDHKGMLQFVPFSRAVATMPADDFHQLVRDTENLFRTWGYDPVLLREEAA